MLQSRHAPLMKERPSSEVEMRIATAMRACERTAQRMEDEGRWAEASRYWEAAALMGRNLRRWERSDRSRRPEPSDDPGLSSAE